MKVYVAGKVTGLPKNEVFRKFNGSVRTLKEGGHAVMSPAVLVLNEDFEHEDYMHVCYAMIDVCDAVFMQRDWWIPRVRGWSGNTRPTTGSESSMRTNRPWTTAQQKGKGKRHGLTRTRCTVNDMADDRTGKDCSAWKTWKA